MATNGSLTMSFIDFNDFKSQSRFNWWKVKAWVYDLWRFDFKGFYLFETNFVIFQKFEKMLQLEFFKTF